VASTVTVTIAITVRLAAACDGGRSTTRRKPASRRTGNPLHCTTPAPYGDDASTIHCSAKRFI
jgi:2-polyprenyl-6-methoxyphenol hydroxylase-like FAD-dependent oxidoreductase